MQHVFDASRITGGGRLEQLTAFGKFFGRQFQVGPRGQNALPGPVVIGTGQLQRIGRFGFVGGGRFGGLLVVVTGMMMRLGTPAYRSQEFSTTRTGRPRTGPGGSVGLFAMTR